MGVFYHAITAVNDDVIPQKCYFDNTLDDPMVYRATQCSTVIVYDWVCDAPVKWNAS